MTERSKARVCGLSLVGIVSSNPANGVDVCVVCCTGKTKKQARIKKTKTQLRKEYKQETREEIQKKNPGVVRNFFLLQNVQKICGAHQASCPIGPLTGREVNHPQVASGKLKNVCSCNSME